MTAAAHAGIAYPARQSFGRGEIVHAVAAPGIEELFGPEEPLCGTFADLEPCPPGLFPQPVTCSRCLATAERNHITIGGLS
jgi:hypothetical protein